MVPARDKRKEIQLPAQGLPVPDDDDLEGGRGGVGLRSPW